MLFSQMSVFATEIDQDIVSDGTNASTAVDDLESIYINDNFSELIVLEEITELREANVKHFSLSNGMNKAVAYSQPVHYMDENGNWIDIDNSLTLQGNEYSTNNKFEIKFANKSGSSGLLSIKDGNYKIDFTPLNTNKVNVAIENPQENNSRKFSDVKTLKKLVSRATYSNIYNGIDIEYILTGNNVKENIIVNNKQDGYTYSFELKLNKLTAELSNGSIILLDSTTGEKMYEIPAPYMYDAKSVMSTDVEYSLTQNSKWKYTFTVTANDEWINAEERVFPITIDPTIIGDIVDVDRDVQSDGIDTSTQSNMIIGNFFEKDTPAFLKFNTLPDIQLGTCLVQAKFAMNASVIYNDDNIDFYIGVYKATKDWITSGFADAFEAFRNSNSDNAYDAYVDVLKSYYASSPENSVQITETGPYEWDITSLYKQWKSGTENHGICVKAVSLGDAPAAAIFQSLESDNVAPQLELTYVEPKGVEDYYGMLTTSISESGVGYVNLFNGELTYINNLTTIENQVLPYEINMIYNSIDKRWTPSFNESIELFENANDAMSNDIVRYIWHDPDGTSHLFTPYLQKNWWGEYVQYEELPNGYLWSTTDPVVFYPEDDIDYVLTKNSNGEFILKHYDGTQRLFDSSGRLSKICDLQGNVQYHSYTNGNLSNIDYQTFDNIHIPQVEFTYDSNNKLSTVYNCVTRLEISLTWNDNNLSKIEYNSVDNTKDKNLDIFYISNAEDSTLIEKIQYDIESKYMLYTFNADGTVYSIQVYDSSNNLKSQHNITYNSTNTLCSDLGTDLNSSEDNTIEKYTFDKRGRKATLSKREESSNTFIFIDSWSYIDDVLPDDNYYGISYSSNINNGLTIPDNDTNIVRYDMATGQETLLSISDLFALDSSSSASETISEEESNSYVSNTITPRDVIGEDTREPITNTTEYPYNSICYLEITYNNLWNNEEQKFKSRTFRGTGVLISPNVLLTAGHNLYNDVTESASDYDDGIRNPRFAEEITVFPGVYWIEDEPPVVPLGFIDVEASYIQNEYFDIQASAYDWGICVLEEDFESQVDCLDISITPIDMVGNEINVIGFPSDKRIVVMHDAVGSVVNQDLYSFLYDADTFGGSSGSPVFINDERFMIYGIHVRGFDETDADTSNDFNGATKISPLIYTVATILKFNE